MVRLIFCCQNISFGCLLAVVFCFALPQTALTAATLPGQRSYKKGDVVIGGLFPVHVRGQFRSKFLSLAEAMVFAIDQINKDSKLLPNITLGYDISDTNLQNRQAMKSTLDYVNVHKFAFMNPALNESCSILPRDQLYPVASVVGTGTSRSSILVSNLLEVEDIPLISYAATSDELSSSAYPSFFRTVPPDRFQSKVMTDIARYFNWTYVAAIAADDAYGRSGIEFFRKQSKPQGICIAYDNYFPVGEQGKERIRMIVEELVEMENVGVIILYCDKTSALSVLKEARRQGLKGRIWIASEAWGDNDDVIQQRDLQPVLKGMLGVVFTQITVPSYKAYLLSRTSLYRNTSWWKTFWEEIGQREYNCTFGVANSALKQCSHELQITEKIFEGYLSDSKATYVINAVYAIAHALDAIYRCESSPMSNCSRTKPFVKPKDALEYLKKVNFSSEVTRVYFDENGDSSASYSIINYRVDEQKGGRVVKVGTWEEGKLKLSVSSIAWNNGLTRNVPRSVCSERCRPGYRQTQEINCCWQCIRCSENTVTSTYGAMNCTKCGEDYISNEDRTKCVPVPLERIHWGDPLGAVITVISVLGALASFAVGAVFVWRNDTPIVKASNRELSYLFLFSIGMDYLWALVNLSEPNDVICPLIQAWFYIFYTIAIVVLGVKTKRIVHLFEHRVPRSELTKGYIEKHKHIFIIVGIGCLDVLILIIWFVVDIPHPYVDKTLRTTFFYDCAETTNTGGLFCRYLLIAILVVMSFVCCYFAFKSRKLPHNFNEGKFIAFALYVLVISWVTLFPVYLNIHGKYSVVVSGTSSIISATGMLVCIFVPKIYIIIFHPEKNTVAYMKSQISNHTFRRSTVDGESRQRSHQPDGNTGSGTTPGENITRPRSRDSPKLSKEESKGSHRVVTVL